MLYYIMYNDSKSIVQKHIHYPVVTEQTTIDKWITFQMIINEKKVHF